MVSVDRSPTSKISPAAAAGRARTALALRAGHEVTVVHRGTGDPAGSERDLTLADLRLGPADLEMLDTLITAGAAASRAETVGWVLARIRERPAYASLGERARELDELKARF
jgi:hypothetical protein